MGLVTQSYADNSAFVRIPSGTPCPICGYRDGRCSEFYYRGELSYISCKYSISSEPAPGLPGWYKHRVGTHAINVEKPKKIQNIKVSTITKEILELRHQVYTDLQALIRRKIPHGLYEEDKADLTRRGISDHDIINMGMFSVPKSSHKVYSDCGEYQMQLATYISKKLYEKYGDDLLKVAGFMKLKSKNGDDYITFKSKMKDPSTKKLKDIRGYFIPYYNVDNKLIGMQYRLSEPLLDNKGKYIRYFWFSSKNASSGSPIDYIVPSKVIRDDVLLLGEGSLKMKIACNQLGYKGMAEAGVNNYNALIKEIQLLETKTRIKYKIILSLDMDKYEIYQDINGEKFYQILEAEKRTVELLKLTGHEVAIAEWDSNLGKGIDDALQNGAKLHYTLV